MLKKNILTNARRRRHFHHNSACKSPSHGTIPEESTLTHSSQVNSFSESHHRPRIKGQDGRSLRICFLILLPMYIIATSLLMRALHSDDGGSGQTLGSSKSNGNRINREIQNNKRLQHKTMAAGRVVYLSINNDFSFESITRRDDNQSRNEKYDTNRNQNDNQSHDRESPYHKLNTIKDNRHCEPMAKWQSMSFPTCNSLHEMNVFSTTPYLQAPVRKSRGKRVTSQHNIIHDTYSAKRLGNGWFRDAWKVSDQVNNSSFAFKTLRIERDFIPEYFELHRRDSVALERLTESPYVMDIYGYCGQSAVTELAFLNNGLNNLYRMATGMMNNFSPYILRTKLQIAAMTATAVAHVHSVPFDNQHVHVDKLDEQYNTQASIVHYDINPRNVIITPSGRPKLNDFNVAEFLTWDPKKKAACGFKGRFREPWWRSPEEMQNGTDDVALTEKVDIYSLGNTLFVLLTGTEPRGKNKKKRRLKQVSKELAIGLKPAFPVKYQESYDPAIVAIRNAIIRCWDADPRRRPSATEIANQLYTALGNLAADSQMHSTA